MSERSEREKNHILAAFIDESLMIEGIKRFASGAEIDAYKKFLGLPFVSVPALDDLQRVIAPGKPLRNQVGMNVRVGRYQAPPGGPEIEAELAAMCLHANAGSSVWLTHVEFEILHPYLDGNGRVGRALWAWQMQKDGQSPFVLPFLHQFYYQTLRAHG